MVYIFPLGQVLITGVMSQFAYDNHNILFKNQANLLFLFFPPGIY